MHQPLRPLAAGEDREVTDAEQASCEGSGKLMATPAFMLLFSVELKGAFPGFTFPVPGVSALPPEPARGYVDQFADFEERLLGEPFRAARRIVRWPLGRIALSGESDASPPHADVFLLEHKAGVALWEAWLPASEQSFDAARWLAWLDPDTEDGLIAGLWRVLAPISQALTGESSWSGTYFPMTCYACRSIHSGRVIERHAPHLVRLLFLNHAQWTFKPEVVRAELERDYCAREGGMTLLSRRSGLDLHARESLATEEAALGLPPRTALPFGEPGLALGQGAGLVEGDGADAPQALERGAALDQDAPARGARDPAQHRARNGDRQRAGARGDQDRHGAVEAGGLLQGEEAAEAVGGKAQGAGQRRRGSTVESPPQHQGHARRHGEPHLRAFAQDPMGVLDRLGGRRRLGRCRLGQAGGRFAEDPDTGPGQVRDQGRLSHPVAVELDGGDAGRADGGVQHTRLGVEPPREAPGGVGMADAGEPPGAMGVARADPRAPAARASSSMRLRDSCSGS